MKTIDPKTYIDHRNVQKLLSGVVPCGAKNLTRFLNTALTMMSEMPVNLVVEDQGNLKGVNSPSWAEDYGYGGGGVSDIFSQARFCTKTINQEVQSLPEWEYAYDLILDTRESEKGMSLGVCKRPADVREENRLCAPRIMIRHHLLGGNEWILTVPLGYLLTGFLVNPKQHMGYEHMAYVGDETFEYAGITKRGWQTRTREHIQGIMNGTRKEFYKAWRHFISQKEGVERFESHLILVNQTFDRIMYWEEQRVKQAFEAGRSLNAIPGGYAGFEALAKMGFLAAGRQTLKDRDAALQRLMEGNPRAGIPNMVAREQWQDDEYYAKVVLSRNDTLSAGQVHEIRRLCVWGHSAEEIMDMVDARTLRQVKGVMEGQHYTRVH